MINGSQMKMNLRETKQRCCDEKQIVVKSLIDDDVRRDS